jgi:putative GTP pyrophosphokinase
MADLKKLKDEYDATISRADRFSHEIVRQIKELFDQKNIHLGSPIEARVKTWSSISEKVTKRSPSLDAISSLHDLVGVRVILLFNRDIASVCRLIESNFRILSKEDKASNLGDREFGYTSIHFVVEMPKSWKKVPTLKDIVGLKAEIQVRTNAQHIWAAASHLLQYKNEASVPVPLRRSITRVAALLETVDLEFERVLSEKEYYMSKAKSGRENDILNVTTLERYLDVIWPSKNKDRDEDYGDLLDDLAKFQLITKSALEPALSSGKKAAIDEDRLLVAEGIKDFYSDSEKERIGRGVFFTHVGLIRSALQDVYGDKYDEILGVSSDVVGDHDDDSAAV